MIFINSGPLVVFGGALRAEVLRIYEGDRGLPLPENSPWERSDSKNDAICMHLKEPRAEHEVFSGNWQADVLRSSEKSASVGVLMEASTLFTLLVRLDDESLPSAIGGFAQILNRVDAQKALSISSGQAAEDIANFTPCLKSAINVYFLTLSSPARSVLMKISDHFLGRTCPRI